MGVGTIPDVTGWIRGGEYNEYRCVWFTKQFHCVWLYWLGIVNVNVCIGCVLHWNRIWVGLSYPKYGACSFRLFGRNNISCLVFSVFPQFRTLMCLPAGGFSYYADTWCVVVIPLNVKHLWKRQSFVQPNETKRQPHHARRARPNQTKPTKKRKLNIVLAVYAFAHKRVAAKVIMLKAASATAAAATPSPTTITFASVQQILKQHKDPQKLVANDIST